MPKRIDLPEPDEAPDLCGQCHHAFNTHTLVCTTDDPLDGGIMLCPVPGCECYSTWGCSTDGKTSPRPKEVPDRFAVAALRETFQKPST